MLKLNFVDVDVDDDVYVDVDVDVDVSQVLPLLSPQLQLGGSDGCGAQWGSPSSPSGGFVNSLTS